MTDSRQIDSNVPKELSVHLVLDNYAADKHQKVKSWLARHSRYQVHFVLAYSSWLNQVERWFALITQRAIRRGSFRNVKGLIAGDRPVHRKLQRQGKAVHMGGHGRLNLDQNRTAMRSKFQGQDTSSTVS